MGDCLGAPDAVDLGSDRGEWTMDSLTAVRMSCLCPSQVEHLKAMSPILWGEKTRLNLLMVGSLCRFLCKVRLEMVSSIKLH